MGQLQRRRHSSAFNENKFFLKIKSCATQKRMTPFEMGLMALVASEEGNRYLVLVAREAPCGAQEDP